MALGFFEAVDPVEKAKNPDYVKARRKLLNELRKGELSTAPVQHWSQGLARMVNSLASRYEENQLSKGESAGNADFNKWLAASLGGGGAASAPAVVPGAAPVSATPSATPGGAADTKSIFARMLTQESGNKQFRPDGSTITSPAGALGIAQIMPGTAPEAAKLAGLPYDPTRLRNDAGYNKALGQAYYNAQVKKFGDPVAAAAAYNAGPGAVNKAISKQDATGRPFTDFLPTETTKYMAAVGGNALAGSPSPGLPAPTAPAQAQPGNNAALLAGMANPAVMARLKGNPVAMALLTKQITKDPVTEGLKRQILLNQSQTSSPEFMLKKAKSGQAGPYGNTLYYGVDPKTGQTVLMQPSKDGGVRRVDTGGVVPTKSLFKIDTGTGTALANPLTGQPQTVIKKDIAGAKAQAAVGAQRGKDIAAAQGDFAKATDAINQIDALMKDQGLGNVTGPIMGRLPNITGDANRAQARIDQIKGQTFLQAYQQLRGGGQITEVEGKKAEAAIARLSQSQSTKDFKAALQELRSIIEVGRSRIPGAASLGAGSKKSQPVVINGVKITPMD